MKIPYTLLFFLGVYSMNLLAQQVEKSESGTFALTNATIETVTNGTINGTLVIKDGLIESLGVNASIPADAKVVDCSGLTIYPGMIDAGTTLGLFEIGSISLTRDADELGEITPHVQALTAINPNSALIPVTRVNGVTTVLTKPTGGLLPGTAALIHLHGYTPNQMYAGFNGILMNFPSSGRRGRFDRRSEEVVKKDSEKALKRLTDTWEEAKLYTKISQEGGQSALDYNPQMESLIPVVAGDAPLLIEVNKKEDILNALKWIKKENIKAVLTGVADGWRVTDSLLAAGVSVITGPVLSIPRRSSDRYDAAYKNAGLMHQAGIKVAIRTNEAENVRNLPYHAGFAATYGMGRDAAFKAVTIVPAEILGVADKVGSLEAGKIANVFITDGDPFETRTQIKHLFIKGWKIPLESRHTLLYEEFLERAPGIKE